MALVHDSHNDFILFPRDQYLDMFESKQDDSFDGLAYSTLEMHHRLSDLTDTYDSYPSTAAFPNSSLNYYEGGALNYAVGFSKENDRLNQQRFTPCGSPSPSVSQSFDQPPSILSSTSGASAQSTASSAVGSPYPHDPSKVSGHDNWSESHQGLGIATGISQHEGYGTDIFPLTDLSSEVVFDDDKYSSHSFVGESSKIFSSSVSSRSNYVPVSISSCSFSQSLESVSCASPLALNTSVVTPIVAIDTIPEELSSRSRTSITKLTSPESANSTGASRTSFGSNGSLHRPIFSPPAQSVFKSPTTPASAMSPFTSHFIPPPGSRPHKISKSHAISSIDWITQQPSSSCLQIAHPHAGPNKHPRRQRHSHSNQPHSLFFSQSSGRFITPLESSCWFSLFNRVLFCFDVFLCIFSDFLLMHFGLAFWPKLILGMAADNPVL